MGLQNLAVNVAKLCHQKVNDYSVFLTGPDGERREYIDCIFKSGRLTMSPDSGEEMVVFNPVATFPRSSLLATSGAIPQNGEIWVLEAPLDPEIPNDLTALVMEESKSSEGGRSLGVIRLYFSQTQQS